MIPQPPQVPGSYGWPLLGAIRDSLDFLAFSGWEKFFRKRERRLGSTVFKTNLFGHKAIAMLDHTAISALVDSADLIQDYGFGAAVPPLGLVGNIVPSVFESGPAHDNFKAMYIELIQTRAPALEFTFDAAFERHASVWEDRGKFSFRDELEKLAATLPFEWILGLPPEEMDEQTVQDVRSLYNGLFLTSTRWSASISKVVPFPPYSRMRKSFQRLLDKVRGSAGFKEVWKLARKHELSDPEMVAKQLLFVLGMNSYLGFQNVFKSLVGELSLRPELCDDLREEISAAKGDAQKKMPLLDRTLREILRLHPPVFFIFGRATGSRLLDSASGSFSVQKGDLLMGVIPIAQRDPALFGHNAEAFDPRRYAGSDASRYLIWPRGAHDGVATASNRTCPGKDASLVFASKLCIALLMGCAWTLESKPRWSDKRYHLNVAAPMGKLAVSSFERI